MNAIEVFETGKKVEVPSSWDELPARQVRRIFRLYDKCIRKGKSPLEFSVKVLFMLIGYRMIPFVSSLDERTSENIYLLCDNLLGFLFAKDSASLSFDSVRNPLPFVSVGQRTLVGPSDLLQDLTFGEFRHASAAINAFYKSKDIEDLDECLAALYRPASLKPNKAGRRIHNVDNGNAEMFLRLASRMHSWQKNLIMLWFSACLDYIQSGTLTIDGEQVSLFLLFNGTSESSGFEYGWNDLLIELARENCIGNKDQIDEEPLFSVLSIMWHNFKENKRLEKLSKK